MTTKHIVRSILGWVVTVLTPLVILMIAIRLLMVPLFARIEYHLPGFPEDPYGFTLEDRLKWSAPSIRFLVNGDSIEDLGSLTFEDGEPIYNDRELSHMADVKAVVTGMRIGLTVAVLVLLTIEVIAVRGDWRKALLTAYWRGGWGVVGLIVAILMFVLIAFDQLFTWFHMLFFQSGTWQFYTSDTLIRLFPIRFWQDAFIFVGVISLLFGGLLIWLCRPEKWKSA
ncbi:MAG: TIGR01906 family membrane protein [Chloroflexota bacterium]|nr:TIGR01906 family membrane protein [Chloroflexota bacterium]